MRERNDELLSGLLLLYMCVCMFFCHVMSLKGLRWACFHVFSFLYSPNAPRIANAAPMPKIGMN